MDEDLAEDVEIKGANRCFRLAGKDDTWSEVWSIDAQGDLKTMQHYKIPLGRLAFSEQTVPYLTLGMTINYIALVQDNDSNPKVGKSHFSNLQLYEERESVR